MESSESGTANGQRMDASSGALTVGQRMDRVNDSTKEAWSRTRETFDDLKDRLDIDGRVKRNPYGMVAAALGVGYVLGGGFFSPLTGRIVGLGLKMGLRLAALPFIEGELRGFAESIVDGAGGDDAETESSGGKGRKAQSSKGTNKGGNGK
jgi:hypothetical protein